MVLELVTAALAAHLCVLWLHARKGWALARRAHADAELVLTHERIERDGLRFERDGLARALAKEQRDRELERGNVRKLVPSYSSAKSSDSNAGFLRMAFRAWLLWFNDCPAVLPFRTLLQSQELDDDTRRLMACELYARAVMESALAQHLDGANPRSDRIVLDQLAEGLGDAFAERVAADVALRGVTFSSGGGAASTAAPSVSERPSE